ncbi:MAG TPA: hypothetical protein VM901_08820 [Bdellovibrionota bacterium]|nr:hypothetical protein [Bdellovibrionota bacterium]
MSRPALDTFVISTLPMGLVLLLIAVPVLVMAALRKRALPRWFLGMLVIAAGAIAPFLGWLMGQQIFKPESKWNAYVYTERDNGYSHKHVGTYTSAESCEIAAKTFLTLPTSLALPGCSESTCYADRFMCGRDCGIDPEHDGSFIGAFVCQEQFFGTRDP